MLVRRVYKSGKCARTSASDSERPSVREELSEIEINELARLFPPGPATSIRLGRAGFDPARLPSAAASSLDYWMLINEGIATGVIADGRRRVLAMAKEIFRFNDVLFGRRGPDVWSVLFLGASATGLDDIRTDSEYRAVIDAGPHIRVAYYPFATVADLRRVQVERPHVLHLACHCRGQELLFTDPSGAAHAVHAQDLADALEGYERAGGDRLRGIVLNACDGRAAAQTLRPRAEVTVAHDDELPDDAAAVFAGVLYRSLAPTGSVQDAAELARRELVLADPGRRRLADGVITVRADR